MTRHLTMSFKFLLVSAKNYELHCLNSFSPSQLLYAQAVLFYISNVRNTRYAVNFMTYASLLSFLDMSAFCFSVFPFHVLTLVVT